MRWHILGLVAALAILFGMPSDAAENPLGPKRHVEVDILAEQNTLEPGGTLTLAVRQTIEPGWHTYWINPGDSGEPTTVEWSLPEGFEAGPLQWPAPHAIPTGPLTNFGYEGSVLALSELKLPSAELSSGPVTIGAKVRYLVCKDICIPEEAEAQLTLGDGSQPARGASAIARARRMLPVELPGSAQYEAKSAETLLLTVNLPGIDLSRAKSARFFPLEWGHISNPAEQPMTVSGDTLSLQLTRGDAKTTPVELKGVLTITEEVNGASQRQAFNIAAKLVGTKGAGGATPANTGPAGAGSPGGGMGALDGQGSASLGNLSLLTAAFFAFLGGLVLNLMPCVFPVLALKALSFAEARNAGSHRAHGFAYLAGVLASFILFAAGILMLREAGQALGWGFQFQSPEFVLGLAALFFALGLSLSGVFSFGGSLMALGDGLTRRPGSTGYFFTGVLAAVAATPCTAPFMGAAVGYAVTQSAAVLFTIFLSLAAGFALPVLLLAITPQFQRWLPKPGRWMETFKQVLAFPLYATASWLVWVLSIQTGSDGVLAAAVAFTGVGFAAWLAGRTALASRPARLAAPALAVAAILAAFSLTPSGGGQVTGAAVASEQGSGPVSEPFTRARLQSLIAEGRPVFVNFTAAWCITCKVNERVALSSERIADAFEQRKITYLKGDWTRQNPEITEMLSRFGRAGVPLYLFYPGNGAEPRILPQILTESTVLDEIAAASAPNSSLTRGA